MKPKKKIGRIGAHGCAILAALFVQGCSSTSKDAVKLFSGISTPDTRVTLLPGDEIEVKFFYTPELNELQYIRADGKIVMQLIGEVDAGGLTPGQLQNVLQRKYAGLIERTTVTVFTRELSNRNVFVGGAVHEPGMFPMSGTMTAMEAIMHAGGFDMTQAELGYVIVLRNVNNLTLTYRLDLKEALFGETPPRPFYLHAQDVVFVQRTDVVKTAQWISQHINQMVPQFGFTYFYNTGTGDSTIGIDTSTSRR